MGLAVSCVHSGGQRDAVSERARFHLSPAREARLFVRGAGGDARARAARAPLRALAAAAAIRVYPLAGASHSAPHSAPVLARSECRDALAVSGARGVSRRRDPGRDVPLCARAAAQANLATTDSPRGKTGRAGTLQPLHETTADADGGREAGATVARAGRGRGFRHRRVRVDTEPLVSVAPPSPGDFGPSKRVLVSAAPRSSRHRFMLRDSIASLRGPKSGQRHMTGGKGAPASCCVCALAGTVSPDESRAPPAGSTSSRAQRGKPCSARYVPAEHPDAVFSPDELWAPSAGSARLRGLPSSARNPPPTPMAIRSLKDEMHAMGKALGDTSCELNCKTPAGNDTKFVALANMPQTLIRWIRNRSGYKLRMESKDGILLPHS